MATGFGECSLRVRRPSCHSRAVLSNTQMDKEVVKYFIEQCRDWMLPEEKKALFRFSCSAEYLIEAREHALANYKLEDFCGFNDRKTNELADLSLDTLKLKIATRLLSLNEGELLNKCSKCNELARTPRAKQCRFCGNDWH